MVFKIAVQVLIIGVELLKPNIVVYTDISVWLQSASTHPDIAALVTPLSASRIEEKNSVIASAAWQSPTYRVALYSVEIASYLAMTCVLKSVEPDESALFLAIHYKAPIAFL